MAWSPPVRPAWVSLVNSGAVSPIVSSAMDPFTAPSLVDQARVATGLSDFGSDDWEEPLALLCDDLEESAELTVLGRWMTRRFLLRLLRGRLLLTAATPPPAVRAPILITGAPRTGTTILHALLAAEPALRAPLGWELLYPTASSPTAAFSLAEDELRLLALADPAMDSIHVYGAGNPKECLSTMSFAFRSEEFTARYHVPRYAAWLDECDLRPAYEMHARVLGLLQRPGDRWLLKSPVHLRALDVWRDVYPDSRVVITHRDPVDVVASTASLIANLRWVHSDAVDFDAVAAAQLSRIQRDLESVPTDGVHHVRYSDFMAAPLEVLRAVYAYLGVPFVDVDVRARLDARPQGAHGDHLYAPVPVPGFDRYRERFL